MAEYDVFAEIIKEFGEPDLAVTISAEEAATYRGRVPDALIRFWQEHGRGSYFDKIFTLCDPEDFTSVTKTIFSSDPEFLPVEIEVVGYNQYGDLSCWTHSQHLKNRGVGRMTVFSPDKWRNIDGSRPDKPPDVQPDLALASSFASASLQRTYIVSDQGEDLGVVARRVIGPLEFVRVRSTAFSRRSPSAGKRAWRTCAESASWNISPSSPNSALSPCMI